MGTSVPRRTLTSVSPHALRAIVRAAQTSSHSVNYPSPPPAEAAAVRQIASTEALGQKLFAEFAPGRRLAWHRFGSGPALVLLHGGHGSWLHWIRNIEALSKRYTLWIADMPGFGESDDLEEPTVRSVAEAVMRSLDFLAGATTPIGVAGFSFGGLIATQFAVLRKNVRRLALIGTAGTGGVRRQHLPMVQWRNLPPEEETAALRQNLESLMLTARSIDDPLAMAVHRRACYGTRFRSRPLSRQGLLPPLLDALDIPVLFIWGSTDVTVTPEVVGPEITRGHPQRRFTVIPDTGHWAQFESHAAVDVLLAEWFTGM